MNSAPMPITATSENASRTLVAAASAPITGPPTAPAAESPDISPTVRDRRSRSVFSVSHDMAADQPQPPATPCSARAAIRMPKVGATAKSAAARTKHASPAITTWRGPKRPASHPAGIAMTTKVT